MVPGAGSVICEYWNGSGWDVICIMVTWGQAPFYSVEKRLFESDIALTDTRKFYVRFGKMLNWTKNTINSVEKYWIRIRISADITTRPIMDRMKIQTHNHKINGSGIDEYFGNSRTVGCLEWDINSLNPSSVGIGDSNLYLSDTISAGRTENIFANSQTNRLGINRYIPADMDTSVPLMFAWSWSSSVIAGDVNWRVRWASSVDSDLVYTSISDAPASFSNEKYIDLIETVPGVAYSQTTTNVELDFCSVSSNPELSETGGLIWICIERLGSDDTCVGDVNLINISTHYVKWRGGMYLDMFGDV